MKTTLFLLLAILSSCFSLHAKFVDTKLASEIGLVLMREKNKDFKGEVRSISKLNLESHSAIYIINFAPQGWMLLSSDDSTLPLVAYSKEGAFKVTQNLPSNMKAWLTSYSKKINSIAELNLNTLPDWNVQYRLSRSLSRAIVSPIEPLIKVQWNQSEPYNVYCPKSGGKHTLVGCVAVAMGQALSVIQYPARPKGKHSYASSVPVPIMDFDAEKPYDWGKILKGTEDNYDEAARFLYHLGVSVNMDYGLKASGTYTTLVPGALTKFFSYPEDLTFEFRDKFNGDWKQFIANELGAGRPLIYSGADLQAGAGHAFNIDGYDADGLYHVNWGWGGVGNAYYSLDALRDQVMNMDYMAQQGAVIGLRLPSDAPKNILLSNKTAPSGEVAGQLIGKLSVENSRPDHEYEFSVRGKYDKVTGLYQDVPFKVIGDELFTSASLSASSKRYEIEILVIDKSVNVSIKQGFLITITGNAEALKTIEEATSMHFVRATQIMKLTSLEGVQYKIVSEDGKVVLDGTFKQNSTVEWNTKDCTPGNYIINLSKSEDFKSIKVHINPKK